MTVRRAVVVAAITFALLFLPAGPASASTDMESEIRQRTVIITGSDGLRHTCYLTFGIINTWSNEFPDSASAWTQSDSNDSSPPDDQNDPACGDATVEVSMTYSVNGDQYVRTATRYPNTETPSGSTFVSVEASSGEFEDGNSDFDTLSSNHRVYFAACDCAFTENLILRK